MLKRLHLQVFVPVYTCSVSSSLYAIVLRTTTGNSFFFTGANEAFHTWIKNCEEKMASKFRLVNYYISDIL